MGKRGISGQTGQMEECIQNTNKNVYKAEEVEKVKIENSQRPIKSGPLLPLQTCGTWHAPCLGGSDTNVSTRWLPPLGHEPAMQQW